jgi:hypothetical protein
MLRSLQLGLKAPEKDDSIPLRRGHLEIHRGRRAAAAAAGEANLIVDDQIDGSRGRDDVDAMHALVRRQAEVHRLEVDHERIRQHVVRTVRPPVESSRIFRRQREGGVVDNDVAANGVQSPIAQRTGKAPPALQRHVRVAAALQNQVPVQHAILELPAEGRASVPDIGGAEHVQTREGGYHLDGGGGTARGVDVLPGDQFAGIRIHDDKAHRTRGQMLCCDGLCNGRRRAAEGESGRRTNRKQHRRTRQPLQHETKVAHS